MPPPGALTSQGELSGFALHSGGSSPWRPPVLAPLWTPCDAAGSQLGLASVPSSADPIPRPAPRLWPRALAPGSCPRAPQAPPPHLLQVGCFQSHVRELIVARKMVAWNNEPKIKCAFPLKKDHLDPAILSRAAAREVKAGTETLLPFVTSFTKRKTGRKRLQDWKEVQGK